MPGKAQQGYSWIPVWVIGPAAPCRLFDVMASRKWLMVRSGSMQILTLDAGASEILWEE